MDGTLTNTTTPGQRRPGSNGIKGVLYIHQSSRTGASPQMQLGGGLSTLQEMHLAVNKAALLCKTINMVYVYVRG